MADLRTREGREAEVLAHLAEYGGASVVWLTESQARACAVDRLERSGRITLDTSDSRHRFPFCPYRIQEAPRG